MSRLLVVVVHSTDPPARLGEWLRTAGMELDERHLSSGDALPEGLAGFDGMVVLGGPQSALDDEATSPELVAETLGEHVFEHFLRNKWEEFNSYRQNVTPFELRRYLPGL